ncbi:hypothetical protein NQ318_000423 [Aromia moschata]|uniref:Uncharacterized protein n=1 Tax=Aromia moschata TaxID=1265417 RepID=A0AAV8YW96_9CUCU|nr:hypothetical protein NQ318_000423 [Aromia moschata]
MHCGQGNGTGGAADTCSAAAGSLATTAEPPGCTGEEARTAPSPAATESTPATPTEAATRMPRSESYRRIVEAAESGLEDEDNTFFFNRFRPTAKFVNIEKVPRSKSIKIFEFFNVRKPERRIYETFPEGRHLLKVFNKERSESDSVSTYSPNPLSPRRLKDKQLDRRFWKQLSRRRGSKVNVPA